MKRVFILGILFQAMLLHAGTVTYSVDASTDFSNPERGWYPTMYYYGAGSSSNEMVNSTNFQNDITNSSNYANDTNITLIKRIYDFGGLNGASSYQNSALPSQVLTDITSDFSNARNMGVKLILRFDYNEGPTGAADAPQSIILNHISQLQPLLQANEDVIAYMEAGFIGTWGEWHDSTNGLTDVNNANSTAAESTILTSILSALPSDRMVAVRYPGYTLEIFNTTSPVSAANAFNGSNYSRCGTHDDCFESDQYDAGTFQKGSNLGWSVAQFKSYLNQQNYSVAEGGESCATSSYSTCSNSMADLQSQHWSAMHCQYEQGVIQGWETGGCITNVDLGLGYRYALLNSTVPSTATLGGTLSMSFQVANNGFSNCYNPRNLEIVLRPTGQSGTGTVIYLTPSSSSGTDPRFWQPGSTVTANVSVTVPSSLAAGTYNVLLDLSDPKPSLNGTPAYSIRLADSSVWESSTGYNNLNQTLTISSCSGCTASPTPTPSPVVTGTILSVDFVGGSASNGTPPNMGASEVAGVVSASNWNNAGSTSGSLSNIVDNAGSASSASLTWNAPGGIWSLPITASPGNNDMMMGYLDALPAQNTVVTVSTLPAMFSSNGYSIYAYFDGDNGTASRQASFTIGGTTLTGTDAPSTNFSGSFSQALAGGNGNYVLFSNLTYTSFTLTVAAGTSTDAYPRGPLNGIQIVCNSSSASPTLTASPNPSKTPSPSFTSTLSPSPTWTPTFSPTASSTATKTLTQSSSPTRTPSPTSTATFSLTLSSTASKTLTPSPSSSPSQSPTLTLSPSSSETSSPSWTPSFSSTPSPSGTKTSTPSSTLSLSPSNSPSWSPTSSPTETATSSPTPSFSSSMTKTLSPSPSLTPTSSPTETLSFSPSPAATKTSSPSATLTDSPSLTLSSSPSGTPSLSPTLTKSPTSSPTASWTQTLGNSPSPSSTLTASPSITESLSASPSLSPSSSSTRTPTDSVTSSQTPSPTSSVTRTESESPSPSLTASPTLSLTATLSPAPSGSVTPSPSATLSFSAGPSPTSSSTLSASPTSSCTPSVTPTDSPSLSKTPSLSPSMSPSLTFSPSFSPSSSVTPSSTVSATPSLSSTRSQTSTSSPTSSPSASLTQSPSDSPSSSVTSSPSVSATPSLSFTRSQTPTSSPSLTPSASFTQSPSDSPTPSLSPSPSSSASATPSLTLNPSLSPSLSPSATATASPSFSSTASPSASPSPSATLSLSASSTATASATLTSSSTVTSSPSSSVTASLSATPTQSLSPSFTPSLSASPTLSMTKSPSATPSRSPTSLLSPSVTPSPSPTPSLMTSPSPSPSVVVQPTNENGAGNSAPGRVLELWPVPNPQSGSQFGFAVKLSGASSSLSLRVYGRAMVLVGEYSVPGTWSPGWNHFSQFIPGLPNGLYFVQAQAEGDPGYVARAASLMVLH